MMDHLITDSEPSKSKVRLDIFWFKDESIEDMENLHDTLARDIADNLENALEQFRRAQWG